MEVVFNNKEDKKLEDEITYGTILLCKEKSSENKFDIYRVARSLNVYYEKMGLYILHDKDNFEETMWESRYDNAQEMIKELKKNYDVIQVVDAHIVVDKVIGEV